MKELKKKTGIKQKEVYFYPLNYFDEAKLSKVVGSRQKLPYFLSFELILYISRWRTKNKLEIGGCIVCGKISKFLDFCHQVTVAALHQWQH